jgi:transcriptional regulator with XRE-family HTH domain
MGGDEMKRINELLVENRLVQLRHGEGLPQWQIALASGVKEGRLSKLENGMPPSPLDVERLTVFFGVPKSEIWPDM